MTRTNETKPKILLVDDEEKVLDSYRRTLRNDFDVHIALGGRAALETLRTDGPFKVIVSDIKMPSMTGIELLSQVSTLVPDTIRIVLTGYAELDIVINAINRGEIFRFLTKPCDRDTLINTIRHGVEQYDLVEAAREHASVVRAKKGLESTLRAFVQLVEFRDPYTAGHMDRVADIAVMIAEEAGLSSDRTEGLRLAAMVHDIGKIAIPSGILNKPGILNEAEFTLIKAHPVVGSETFTMVETPWPIARLIREHHERIDGTGYPDGLKRDQILEESRILAVADITDALMSHRPYRQTLGLQNSIKFLEANKGTALEAEYVDIAVKLLKEERILGELGA